MNTSPHHWAVPEHGTLTLTGMDSMFRHPIRFSGLNVRSISYSPLAANSVAMGHPKERF